MAISLETIERVRGMVDIVDLIQGHVTLKRAGSVYKALCPFHKEKTPSFTVNPARQRFHCFGCGVDGDVFKFVSLYENLDFPAAVRRLAERAGVEIAEETGVDREARKARQRLLDLHAAVAERWRGLLLEGREAEGAREYLRKRQIPLTWVEEYKLGYAADRWDDLRNWAKGAGYDEELLLQAGLVVRSQRGDRLYDRFRNRLVFCLCDEQGQVIGFSARLLDAEAREAKYINSPETPLFTKSRVLFGFDRAKRAILQAERAVVCEGQIDVLRCHASGFANVVAPLGTAFTDEHARVLRRVARDVTLCLDGDTAGQRAAARAAEVLLGQQESMEALVRSDLGIGVVVLPPGQDPDSYILGQGVEAFGKLLETPVDYVDHLAERLLAEGNRRRAVEQMAVFLGKVPGRAYREELQVRAAHRLQMGAVALGEEVEKLKRRGGRAAPGGEAGAAVAAGVVLHPQMADLLRWALARPEWLPEMQRCLDPRWIEGKVGAKLLQKLLDLYNQEVWRQAGELWPHLEPAEGEVLQGLQMGPQQGAEEEVYQRDLRHMAADLQARWIRERLAVLAQIPPPGEDTPERREARKREILELMEQKKLLQGRGIG